MTATKAIIRKKEGSEVVDITFSFSKKVHRKVPISIEDIELSSRFLF